MSVTFARKKDIAHTSLESSFKFSLSPSPSGDITDFVFPETFWTVLERHSLFMISRDATSRSQSTRPRALTFHSQLICNRGIPMGRGTLGEEKWRDTRVVSHASVTHTGPNYYLNDASWRKTCSRGDFNIATSLSLHSPRALSIGLVPNENSLARNHIGNVIAVSSTRIRLTLDSGNLQFFNECFYTFFSLIIWGCVKFF